MAAIAGSKGHGGVGILQNPPYRVFRRRLILGTAAAIPRSSSRRDNLLDVGAVLPPMGSTRRQQAGRRVASAISRRCFRLSAASSNTLNQLLIHPYPPRKRTLHIHMPHPPNGTVCEEHLVAKNIFDGPSGRYWCRYFTYNLFTSPPYRAS
jgi:hypothetical protein